MLDATLLSSLPKLEPPILTVYLDTNPASRSNQRRPSGARIWLKSHAKALQERVPPSEQKMFRKQLERVERFLETRPKRERGVILFAGPNHWLKSPGDAVRQDDPVVSLETEKTSLDLPAPVTGVLVRILKKKGETAKVGEVIAYLEETAVPKDAAVSDSPGAAPASQPAPMPQSAAIPDTTRVMPAARRLLDEHGLDVKDVTPTGPGGRVLKENILRRLEEGPSQSEPAHTIEMTHEEEGVL